MEPNLFYNAMITRLQSELEGTAFKLHCNARMYISIDLEDLKQEGMIGIWKACLSYDESKVKDENSIDGYCMKFAKFAMLNHIRTYKPDLSLEAYLSVETENGPLQRELEYKPVKSEETPEHKREAVLNALKKIAPKQRTAIMAAFQIEDEEGNRVTADGMSYNRFHVSKSQGLTRLRKMASNNSKRPPHPLLDACLEIVQQDHTIQSRDLMQLTGCSLSTAKRARRAREDMISKSGRTVAVTP